MKEEPEMTAKEKEILLPPKTLLELLRYETETGKLFWRARPVEMFKTTRDAAAWNTRFAEKEAFVTKLKEGYLTGIIHYRKYFAHRVIWAMVTGEWPRDQIDHKDHDRANNRFGNLRESSQSENCRNKSRQHSNKSGVTGVHWYKAGGKWAAQIAVDGKQIHLGYFTDKAEAAEARLAAEIKHGFHPNHGQVPIPDAIKWARPQMEENHEASR